VEDGEADDEFNNDSRTVIDGTRKKKIDKPKWIMAYIFLCLMNLPDVISKYGPLRMYWEGGGLGEKVLQQLKLLWIGFRKNWQENTLKDIYQHGELIRIQNELKKETKYAGPKMFHIYSDYITARNTFIQNKPMSVFGMVGGMLGICFSTDPNESFSVLPLSFE
jgi:hypothetical protein